MSDSPRRPASPKSAPGKPARPGAGGPKEAAAGDGPAGERIAKVLSRAGIASRREAERMIAAGQVTVNGTTITSAALNVTPSDRITVAGQPVAAPEAARLWLYYKPDGLVTSAADEKGRETVFDRLPPDLPRVMSIGRLDLNSEGLLLLTNDGELKRRLELPSTGWLRKYRVRVKGNPVDPDLEPLRQGITVEGERFQPMTVTLDRVQGANAWLTIGLREGRNREIRRALTTIGLTVNRLIRVSYGPFRLGELQPGEVSEVRGKVLRDQLGGQPDTDPEAGGTARAKPRRKPATPRGAAAGGGGTAPASARGARADRTGTKSGPASAGTGPAAKSGTPAVRRRGPTPATPGEPPAKGPGAGSRRPAGKGGPGRTR
jgi:23S rRNA pseudouridine2605 synthase